MNNDSDAIHGKIKKAGSSITSVFTLILIGIAMALALMFFDIFRADELQTAKIRLFFIIASASILLTGIMVIYLLLKIKSRMKKFIELRKTLEQTNKFLYVLTNIQHALFLSQTEVAFLDHVCKIAVEIGGFRMAWIGYAEQNEPKLFRTAAKAGREENFIEKVQFSWNMRRKETDPVCRAVADRKPVIINDIANDPKCAHIRDEALRQDYLSMASVPIVLGNKLLCVLNVFSAATGTFEKESSQLIGETANAIAYGIMSLRKHEKKTAVQDILLKNQTVQEQGKEEIKPPARDDSAGTGAGVAGTEFRSVFENSPDAICILNQYSIITDINTAAINQIGYGKPEIIGKRIETFYTPESKKIFPEQFQRLLNTGSFRKEMELQAKNGKKLNSDCFGLAVKKSSGELDYLIFYHKDINENKILSSEISEFRHLIDAATEAMGLANLNGILLYTNNFYDKLFGAQKSEMIGKPAKVIEENKEAIREGLAKNRAWESEIEIRTKESGKRPAAVNITNFSDSSGNISGYIIIIRDLKQLRDVEEALHESEERFNSTFEKGPFGMAMVGLDYRVLNIKKVNATLCTMLDYSEQSMLNLRIPDITHPEDAEKDIDNSKKLFEGEIPYYSTIKRFPKKNKDIFWANVISFIIRDKKGQPLYRLLLFEDITERQQDQQKMDQMLADLQRSNAELEQFAYISSHDLQEPLRMITSYVQLLEKRYKNKLDADANDFINFISDGAIRMHRLIQDLLEYSRVTTRGKPFEPVDTSLVFQEATANLKTAITESGAVIVHDNLPTVLGDSSQLSQLFQNLIANSIKFRHKNHPVNRFPHIYISVTKQQGDWLFSFRDNGIGFDAQYSERIFMIFQRLHSKAEYPGTGIGLSICRKIVGRHGGKIWAVSEPNAGATFYFTIPIKGRVE